MSNLNRAKRTLTYYFKLASQGDWDWDYDNQSEIEGAIETIVEAAVAQATRS